MCGYIFSHSKHQISPERLERASRFLDHRGPDDSTTELHQLPDEWKVTMIHKRLAIIDLDARSNQPFYDKVHGLVCLYNGEIYNYIELRNELIQNGYKFETESDTEVLLKSYHFWGQKCVERFVGMFSFVIKDDLKQQYFLARDHFGIKPLYYFHAKDFFGAASEILPLLEISSTSPKSNVMKAMDFLIQKKSDDSQETFFQGIKQLPPAHTLCVGFDNKIIKLTKFWEVSLKTTHHESYDKIQNTFKQKFFDSVKLHLRSDVEQCVTLSGGLDSTAILRAEDSFKKEHITFSYIDDNPKFNESKWVNIALEGLQSKRHFVQRENLNLKRDLRNLVRCQGEPFISLSILAQNKIHHAISEKKIKVVLEGQGADEVLGGYQGYTGERLAGYLASLKIFSFLKLFFFILKQPHLRKKIVSICRRTAGCFLPYSLRIKIARKGVEKYRKYFKDQLFNEYSGSDSLMPVKYDTNKFAKEHLKYQLEKDGLPKLLRYCDRNSMASSIESRVPFLDYRLAEFVFSIPDEYLFDATGRSKSLLRDSLTGVLPEKTRERIDKVGFRVDEIKCLIDQKEYVSELLQAVKGIPFLNADKIENLWEQLQKNPHHEDLTFFIRVIIFVSWVSEFKVEF